MEMEHINENTIRVLIKSEDLATRGITFLDLLGNHAEIENFFYSILEEVDIDDEFKGSDAVTFQVLPKGDGLELFISKNLPMDDYEALGEMNGTPQDVSEFLKRQIAEQLQEDIEDDEADEAYRMKPDVTTENFVFEMGDFEQMILLANEVHIDQMVSDLYTLNDFYFLEVRFTDELISDGEIDNYLANIAEFARRSPVTPETLAEHGQKIMERDAFELTRHYFK